MVKAVIFDLWNTLVYASTYETTLEIARKYPFPSDFDANVFLTKTVEPLMTADHDIEKEFFAEFFSSWGTEISEGELEDLSRLWKCRLDDAKVFAETEDVLNVLGETYQLGLLSNLTCHALNVFQSRFDLERHFRHTIYSCVEGVMKPDKEIFEIALNRFGIEPG
ncbi:MAG: HAD family hydrolase, partial [Candidatus Altiarchaeota archaeon]